MAAGRNIQGYLHDLSELKTSKKQTSYFTAILQTGETSHSDLVYFGSEDYTVFRDLFKSGTAVQMEKVKVITATSGSRWDAETIECNKSCKIQNTVLSFSKGDPPQQVHTLSDVQQYEKYRKVSCCLLLLPSDILHGQL